MPNLENPNKAKAYFDLGYDYGRYNLPLPYDLRNDARHWDFKQDFVDGHSLGHTKSRLPQNLFVRKWLQIRLRCLRKDRECTITPADIERVHDEAKGRCPVTRAKFTYGTGENTDFSIDRVNNDIGYTPENIVAVSAFINTVKDRDGFEDMMLEMRCRFDATFDDGFDNTHNALAYIRIVRFYAKKFNIERKRIGFLLLILIPPPLIISHCIHAARNPKPFGIIHHLMLKTWGPKKFKKLFKRMDKLGTRSASVGESIIHEGCLHFTCDDEFGDERQELMTTLLANVELVSETIVKMMLDRPVLKEVEFDFDAESNQKLALTL